jgi:hypothetical protein
VKHNLFLNPPRVTLARNKSWRASAALGLAAVYWMPTRLFGIVGAPLLALLTAALELLWSLLIFTVTLVVLISAGMAGRLRHTGWDTKPEKETAQ